MKTFWICVFTILTLLGATSGSGNTNKEDYWTNWTWQNTFDFMIILWMLNYCAIALYLSFQYTSEKVRLPRLQRGINRKWFHQLELKRQRTAQPKPWQRKPKKKQRKKQGEW